MKDTIKIIIKDNPNHLAQEAVKLFFKTASESARKKGVFTVAVSGGSTPRQMYRLFVKEPYFSEIPWDKTHLFWVDERCVSYSHQYSNFGAAEKDFINNIPIPDENVHPMPVESLPEVGSVAYQDVLIDFFNLEQRGLPRFDLIILGIGKDGHTASLFPGQSALDEKERLVVTVKGGNPEVSRLTMTLPVLNNAREILILVSGEQKAETLKTVLESNQAMLPVQKVRPISGILKWLIDLEAASMISKKI